MIHTSSVSMAISELLNKYNFVEAENAALKIKVAELTSHNSAMDAIAALADKWCDLTNQPDNICVALYQFTSWARQQHQ